MKHPSRRNLLVGFGAVGVGAPLFAANGDPVVNVTGGRVRGALSEHGIHIFKGIPYGAPTGGAGRFMPPRRPMAWSGIRNATAYGASAPQPALPPGGVFPQLEESEDCLLLNVWTPASGRTRRRAVMVWLHGGGFETGSGSAPVHDGGNLARLHDVVVVTINHRLNAFGYTYLGSLDRSFAASGNVGQLDIILALRWVRDNIANFGGDPANVTIFGQSGGGMKVAALLAMPAAKGLFHKAIIESGPGLYMADAEDQTRAARALLAECQLAPNDLRGLQAIPLRELVRAYSAVQSRQPRGGARLIRTFSPTVDGASLPSHPFAPGAPLVSADIPLLIGYTRTETTAFPPGGSVPVQNDATAEARLKPILGDAAAGIVGAYRSAMPDAVPWDIMILASTEAQWGAFSREIALRKAALKRAPVYLYRFDWETQVGTQRAPHAIEVPFVFANLKPAAGRLGATPGQEALATAMSSLWTSFAKTGRPIAAGVPDWIAYGPARDTLLINNQSVSAQDPDGRIRSVIDQAIGLD